MRPSPFPPSKNSTTVRSRVVRSAASLMPSMVLRVLADQFLRPQRRTPLPRPPTASTPAHAFTLDVGGETVAAWDWGQGPTVLLLHGWNGHAGQMTAFVDPLVAAGHHVVAIDLPAHGRSSGTATTLVLLSSLIAELGRRFRPLHGVVAHSFGAAATGLAMPRGLEVQRVALLAPPRQPKQFVQAFADLVGLAPSQVDAFAEAVERRVGVPFSAVDVVPAVRQARAGLLVVHDLDDADVPFVDGQSIAEAWPGGKFLGTQGLGHRKVLRDAKVIQHVLRFIARSEAAHPADKGPAALDAEPIRTPFAEVA